MAMPATIAAFVRDLDRDPPARLAGLARFRLPTQADARAWSLPTRRAELARQPLRAELAVTLQDGGAGAAREILIANRGAADAPLPHAVRIAGDGAAADGINGYTMERDAQGLYLRRARDGLHAGARRHIGWVRCRTATPAFHVQPRKPRPDLAGRRGRRRRHHCPRARLPAAAPGRPARHAAGNARQFLCVRSRAAGSAAAPRPRAGRSRGPGVPARGHSRRPRRRAGPGGPRSPARHAQAREWRPGVCRRRGPGRGGAPVCRRRGGLPRGAPGRAARTPAVRRRKVRGGAGTARRGGRTSRRMGRLHARSNRGRFSADQRRGPAHSGGGALSVGARTGRARRQRRRESFGGKPGPRSPPASGRGRRTLRLRGADGRRRLRRHDSGGRPQAGDPAVCGPGGRQRSAARHPLPLPGNRRRPRAARGRA